MPTLVQQAAALDISEAANREGVSSFTLSFRFFNGKRITTNAPSTSTVVQLKTAVEQESGVHRATARFVFAGNTLKDDDVLKDVVVDKSVIFVLELKTFPAALGPFKAASVPFSGKDFDLPPLDESFSEQGCMWIMEQRTVSRHGLRGRGIEFPLCGQLSPPHPITLTVSEKAAIAIPNEATSFVFSYPVVSFDELEGGSDVARSFLSVGGYAYLNASKQIIHTTTLLPTSKDAGGLQFLRSAKWQAEWTTALMREGRFQRITIAQLNSVGAFHFCWLRPGEVIRGADGAACETQPSVPHGGFAYLFHRDVFVATDKERSFDRYFPIASGEDYIAEDAASTTSVDAESAATFALVSGLQEVRDLEEAQAADGNGDEAAGADGSQSQELQARIVQLERQLDSVTKCVACLVEDKTTILEPCSHLCMCASCALRVQRCPICRADVRQRKRAFQA